MQAHECAGSVGNLSMVSSGVVFHVFITVPVFGSQTSDFAYNNGEFGTKPVPLRKMCFMSFSFDSKS